MVNQISMHTCQYTHEVLDTSTNCQTVRYVIKPDGGIPERIFRTIDQLLVVTKGNALITQDRVEKTYANRGIIFIAKGTRMAIKNIGQEDLVIMVFYSPPFFSCEKPLEGADVTSKPYIKYHHYYYSTN